MTNSTDMAVPAAMPPPGTGATANPPAQAGARSPAPVRSVHVIVNSSAGAGDPGAANDRVRAAFGAAGLAAYIEIVSGAEIVAAARRAMASARSGHVDAIVVGGGDGTIHTIAGLVAGSGIPIGILPLGTLNHFARDVGVPLELEGAVAAVAAGHSRAVDIGEVNGRVFVNNSSVGIYPYMVLDRDRRRDRDRHPKWIAMALALLRALRRFPRRRLRVKAEGRVAAYRTPCLFVGNNRYDLRFLSVGRRQQLDEGLLHLYVARSSTRWGFVGFAIRAAFGIASRVNDLDEVAVRSAEITTRARRLIVALDGEVERLATPLTYRIRPQALHVLLPAPETGGDRA